MLLTGSAVTKAQSEKMRCFSVETVVMPDNTSLPFPLSSHPDMSVIRIGDRLFSCGKICREIVSLYGVPLTDTEEFFGQVYPYDTLFNGFTLCKRLFCKTDAFSTKVSEYAVQNGYTVVPIKQGYAKCSTLIVDDSHIITADRGIAKAAEDYADICLISEGEIELEPYRYGFIGGASAVVGENVFFFGNPDLHSDGVRIRRFIENAGKQVVPLSDGRLCDVGGGVII